MRVIFWIAIAADVVGVFLFVLYGVAAAASSRASAVAVGLLFAVVPGLVVAGAIHLFLRSEPSGWRTAGFIMGLFPWIALAIAAITIQVINQMERTDSRVQPGKGKDFAAVTDAIARNDMDTVAALVRTHVPPNAYDSHNDTLLMLAIHKLRETPQNFDCLRTLLSSAANPNAETYERPLQTAIAVTPITGPEPVKILLTAGANPNYPDHLGTPTWFNAASPNIKPEILGLLLDHGADITAKTRDGQTVVMYAAGRGACESVRYLKQRGAEGEAPGCQ